MAEYIEREAAREAVWQILNGMGYSEKHNDRLVEEVDAVFDEIPAADVRPVVRGKWEERIVEDAKYDPYGFFKRRWYCSECGRYQTYGKTEFCCHCGADMRPEPPKEE